MATSKTAKVEAEIVKVKAKISEFQSKLRELEHKKTGIENTEIVDVVRGMSIPLDELAALLQSIKAGPLPVLTASGQNVLKSKAPAPVENDTDKEADAE